MTVLIVRRRGSLQPEVTVAGRHAVFANLDEPDVEAKRDQWSEEAATGFRPEDDRGLLAGEQLRQRRAKVPEHRRPSHASDITCCDC